jgi:hypothetical protein
MYSYYLSSILSGHAKIVWDTLYQSQGKNNSQTTILGDCQFLAESSMPSMTGPRNDTHPENAIDTNIFQYMEQKAPINSAVHRIMTDAN